MDYMTIKEASEKWGLSIRRMQEILYIYQMKPETKFRNW